MESNNNTSPFQCPFDEQNFFYDNLTNGTSTEVFNRRNVIDRKNLVEAYVGRLGIKWVSVIQ